MTIAVRMQILEKFIKPDPKATRFCHTEFVPVRPNHPLGLPEKEVADLKGYHPAVTGGFKVTCSIENKNQADAFLTIHAIAGTGWDQAQIDFIKSIEFVPVPEAIVPGLEPLLMMRPMKREKRKLAGTKWVLVNARLKKVVVHGEHLDEVILAWEHTDNDGNVDFFEPASTCWKW